MGKYKGDSINLSFLSHHLLDYLKYVAWQQNTTVTRYINDLVIRDMFETGGIDEFPPEVAAEFEKLNKLRKEEYDLAAKLRSNDFYLQPPVIRKKEIDEDADLPF